MTIQTVYIKYQNLQGYKCKKEAKFRSITAAKAPASFELLVVASLSEPQQCRCRLMVPGRGGSRRSASEVWLRPSPLPPISASPSLPSRLINLQILSFLALSAIFLLFKSKFISNLSFFLVHSYLWLAKWIGFVSHNARKKIIVLILVFLEM